MTRENNWDATKSSDHVQSRRTFVRQTQITEIHKCSFQHPQSSEWSSGSRVTAQTHSGRQAVSTGDPVTDRGQTIRSVFLAKMNSLVFTSSCFRHSWRIKTCEIFPGRVTSMSISSRCVSQLFWSCEPTFKLWKDIHSFRDNAIFSAFLFSVKVLYLIVMITVMKMIMQSDLAFCQIPHPWMQLHKQTNNISLCLWRKYIKKTWIKTMNVSNMLNIFICIFPLDACVSQFLLFCIHLFNISCYCSLSMIFNSHSEYIYDFIFELVTILVDRLKYNCFIFIWRIIRRSGDKVNSIQ